MSEREPVYRTLILDVDSTLSDIEGINWLAAQRGELVAQRIAGLTERAMDGGVPLERIYGLRLGEIRPRRDEVDALSRMYVETIAPGAVDTIARLRRAGVQVVLVSGGLRHALLRLALHVGLGPSDLHAVSIQFDALGAYVRYDEASPLTRADGKRQVLADLKADRPIMAVGDGATDVVMRDVADTFVAFTGFARRPYVVDHADASVASFAELEGLVLPRR
ncbi:MAG TPA: HAD-IB family phosphatase [Gemmatimonadaceae bacterium]|nr:HAD-IB family phosphatase [Gemmatimonadaceae bacterium]